MRGLQCVAVIKQYLAIIKCLLSSSPSHLLVDFLNNVKWFLRITLDDARDTIDTVTLCQWCQAGHWGMQGRAEWDSGDRFGYFPFSNVNATLTTDSAWSLLTGDCIARSAADRWIARTVAVDRAHHQIKSIPQLFMIRVIKFSSSLLMIFYYVWYLTQTILLGLRTEDQMPEGDII